MVSQLGDVELLEVTEHTSASMVFICVDTRLESTQRSSVSKNIGDHMSLNNPLANVLSAINNAERVSHKKVVLQNTGRVIEKVLAILQQEKYVESFEFIGGVRGGTITVTLCQGINKIGVITPNFSVKFADFQKWEQRYLPAKDFGILIVSTSQGMMTHYQAQELGIGGRLLAYCY